VRRNAEMTLAGENWCTRRKRFLCATL